MGIQDKISNSQARLKRKLFDYKVFISGTRHQLIRLKTEQNKYGDETIDIISSDKVILYLDIPGDLPLSRLRSDILDPTQAQPENIFLFDILPVEGYSQFKDNVEKGDIFIKTIYFDNANKYYLVLRVSEVVGAVVNNSLTWKKFQCAPYNMILPYEVQVILDEYELYY